MKSEREVVRELVERIAEVLNLPDNTGKGLALSGKGYVLLYRIRTDLAAIADSLSASVPGEAVADEVAVVALDLTWNLAIEAAAKESARAIRAMKRPSRGPDEPVVIKTCQVCLRSLDSCDEKLCPGKFKQNYPTPAVSASVVTEADAKRNAKLLLGFMLECNVIGAKEAGVNLAHSIKNEIAALDRAP